MRKNLIKARRSKGLTQVELAKILNISENYYQSIEYGKRQGSIKIWDKLEELFNTSQRELREVSAKALNSTVEELFEDV